MKGPQAQALVLAAGKGTRIRESVRNLPKPLIPVDGAPLLAQNLRLLARHDIRRVWINLHQGSEKIAAFAGNGGEFGVDISYSYEEELLGTAGAARNLAQTLSGGTFLVVYGDNYSDCDLTALLKRQEGGNRIGTLALFDRKRNPNSGIAGGSVVLGEAGEIRRFEEGAPERPEAPALVNAGIYAFRPDILEHIPEGKSDFGHDVFPALLKRSIPLGSYLIRGFCYAVDTPEALARTRSALSSGKREGN